MKTALFDLDGVLIDTEGQYEAFWRKIGQDFLVLRKTLKVCRWCKSTRLIFLA